MLLLNSVEPETWYRVRDVAKIVGWSEDTVYEWIHNGHLQAFVAPIGSDKRNRVYMGLRVQGAEILRFVKAHLTVVRVERKLRIRIA